jgi:hypothetical protein
MEKRRLLKDKMRRAGYATSECLSCPLEGLKDVGSTEARIGPRVCAILQCGVALGQPERTEPAKERVSTARVL